jgi:Ca2+:H+ antiporter
MSLPSRIKGILSDIEKERLSGRWAMGPLLAEIRQNRLLWLLAGVPVLFAVQAGKPDAHALLFVLSVLAVVPLAALLSRATESVAAKTGDTVGGLLNATLGNLTELIIALTPCAQGNTF